LYRVRLRRVKHEHDPQQQPGQRQRLYPALPPGLCRARRSLGGPDTRHLHGQRRRSRTARFRRLDGVIVRRAHAAGPLHLSAAFFNPSQDIAPTFVARWRIEQPWGHIQAGVTEVTYALNDGMFLNKTLLGYGGALSGNFYTWGKDNLTWVVGGGDGIGDHISN